MTAITPADLSREAQTQFTPRAIAAYAAAHGVLLTADLAQAISKICTTIQKGEDDGRKPSTPL